VPIGTVADLEASLELERPRVKTNLKVQILFGLAALCCLPVFVQQPLGWPEWVNIICPIVAMALMLATIPLRRRAKQRGEPIVTATPSQRKKQTWLVGIIMVVGCLSGPFWLPFTGVHLPFRTLVITSIVSCAFALFSVWLGIKIRDKI
jgi:hypothetical protein